jgi:hypothetical protein
MNEAAQHINLSRKAILAGNDAWALVQSNTEPLYELVHKCSPISVTLTDEQAKEIGAKAVELANGDSYAISMHIYRLKKAAGNLA